MFPVGLPLLAYAGGMVLAWYHPQWRDAYFLCTVAATPAAMTGFLFSKSPSVRNLSLVLAVFLLVLSARASGSSRSFPRIIWFTRLPEPRFFSKGCSGTSLSGSVIRRGCRSGRRGSAPHPGPER